MDIDVDGEQEDHILLPKLRSSQYYLKVDLYDLVIFDHFWPSNWRENRAEF